MADHEQPLLIDERDGVAWLTMNRPQRLNALNPGLTDALLASNTTAIAYETVQGPHGALPLLAPMSEVAGRLSVQAGAYQNGCWVASVAKGGVDLGKTDYLLGAQASA